MLTWTTAPIIGTLAVAIGYVVGRMPCWQTWQGYAGLVIVAPIALLAGVPISEVAIDCAGFGVGFACARR